MEEKNRSLFCHHIHYCNHTHTQTQRERETFIFNLDWDHFPCFSWAFFENKRIFSVNAKFKFKANRIQGWTFKEWTITVHVYSMLPLAPFSRSWWASPCIYFEFWLSVFSFLLVILHCLFWSFNYSWACGGAREKKEASNES